MTTIINDTVILDYTCQDADKIKEFIHRRRRQLVFNSIVYYRFQTQLITDHQWDTWARELSAIQQRYPEYSKEVEYKQEDFIDWDGSTGYHLNDQNYISKIQVMLDSKNI